MLSPLSSVLSSGTVSSITSMSDTNAASRPCAPSPACVPPFPCASPLSCACTPSVQCESYSQQSATELAISNCNRTSLLHSVIRHVMSGIARRFATVPAAIWCNTIKPAFFRAIVYVTVVVLMFMAPSALDAQKTQHTHNQESLDFSYSSPPQHTPIFEQHTDQPPTPQLAQATPQPTQPSPQPTTQRERILVESITYDIDGITTPAALRIALPELYRGKVLPTREQAVAFIEEQKKLLRNLRPIHSSDISYRFVGSNPTQLHLIISVVDSNNIIALPRPEYNSETGWEISIRFRDYNFAGSLNPLAINLDLKLYDDDDIANTIIFSPQLTIPFIWFDTTWQWNTNLEFETAIDADAEASISFDNTLSVNLPFINSLWTLSYLQGVEFIPVNEEQPYFLTSKLSFGSSIPFGISPLLGGVRYIPYLFIEVDYRLDDDVTEDIRGVDVGYNHRLTFGGVYWTGNIREGLLLALLNDNTYNLFHNTLSSAIGIELQWHTTFGSLVALSQRLGTRYGLPVSDEDTNTNDAGDYARGVRDAAANGNLIAYFNNDIKLVGFTNGTALEAQGGLFADGLIATDVTTPFDLQSDVHLGVGIELIGFLLQARSVYIRLAIGFDLLDFLWNGDIFTNNNDEVFLGLGHFY